MANRKPLSGQELEALRLRYPEPVALNGAASPHERRMNQMLRDYHTLLRHLDCTETELGKRNDELLESIQQIRLITSQHDGYENPLLKLKRVQAEADAALSKCRRWWR